MLENIKINCVTQSSSRTEKIILENLYSFLSLKQDAGNFYKTIIGHSDSLTRNSFNHPEIDLFLEMDAVKEKINVHSFSREHNEILSIIKNDMPKRVYDSFKHLSLQFQTNRIPEDRFLDIIDKLAADSKYGINSEKYPNFSLYLKYITLSNQIDPRELERELKDYGLEICETISDGTSLVKKIQSYNRHIKTKKHPALHSGS